MRIGVVGLGSMGNRRIRDLGREGHEFVVWDQNSRRIEDCIDRHSFQLEAAESPEALFGGGVDVAVISTPPDTHIDYLEACYEHVVPFFCEAGILRPPVDWFEERERNSGVRGYPSGTWYFHPLYRYLGERLAQMREDGHQINTFRYHFASFLPLWHPGENPNDFYAGRLKTGAGREMVAFEGNALLVMMGRPKRVVAYHSHRSRLDFEAHDSYHLMVEMDGGERGELTIDLHDRLPVREGRVSTSSGTFVFDVAADSTVTFSDVESGKTEVTHPGERRLLCGLDLEKVYRDEIVTFARSVEFGEPYPKGWTEECALSDLVVAAERSAKEEKWVSLEEVVYSYDWSSEV